MECSTHLVTAAHGVEIIVIPRFLRVGRVRVDEDLLDECSVRSSIGRESKPGQLDVASANDGRSSREGKE